MGDSGLVTALQQAGRGCPWHEGCWWWPPWLRCLGWWLHQRWMRRPLAAGSASPGTAAAASASPSSKASRRRRPRPRIGRAGTAATGVRMPNPIRVVTAPNSDAPRASPTQPGGRPGRRAGACIPAHGQVAGNSQPARVNDGQVLLPPVGWTPSTWPRRRRSLGIARGRRSCPFVGHLPQMHSP